MTEEIAEEFDALCDKIEKSLHNDIRILSDRDYKGLWHIDVQEIGDSDDEEEDWWEEGWFTINSGVFENLKGAIIWLNQCYGED